MSIEAFDYDLPAGAIAQHPATPRDGARLLVAVDPDGGIEHRHAADLPDFLREGDVLVVNDTRVIPARLRLRKATGGAVEVLLLERVGEEWHALVRPGGRVPPGTVLLAGGREVARVGERLDGGRRRVTLLDDVAADAELALPPYIHEELADPERYQTVYAARPGSVAAPTAGLHLTEAVLDRCRARGVHVATLDLAIGLATFRPIKVDHVADHVMHVEHYTIPAATMDSCRGARRVVAVGTTTTRALEAAAATGALEGGTDLFIHRGYPFAIVDVLMTNFHVPRSSLLVLLDAFCGPRWRALYETALAEGYRFLSFGDAMLVARA